MYYEAGLVTFLRTLVIIVGVFYLFRFIMRLVAPWLMRKAASKMKQNMHQRAQQQRNEHRQDGDVTIEYDRKKDSKNHDSHQVGEYVEFEEVDK